MNIIIADDDKIIRQGLRLIISKKLSSNFTIVAEVSNGQEALDIIKTQQIDVLITDIKMPVMDGVTLIKEVAKLEVSTRTIVLSGFDEYNFVRESLKNGAVDYFLKPINREDFKELLLKINEELLSESQKGKLSSEHDSQRQDDNVTSIEVREGELGNSKGGRIIDRAKEYIENNYDKEISLTTVAEYVYLNSSYFSLLFKNETGKNFVDYLLEKRIDIAKKMLQKPEVKVYEVSKLVGYHEISSFNRAFKRIVGVSPSEYKRYLR